MSSAMNRVNIPKNYWTPFPNGIFDEQFKNLEGKNTAAVYAVLYDRAYHDRSRGVKASFSDISRWTDLDARVVKECLEELRRCGLVHKSKSRKRIWKVPAASVDLSAGNWTPVPRMLVQEYIPEYHNSVLLLQFLRIQHYRWMDYCYPGWTALAEKMNWSETRVRDAIEFMSDVKKWKKRTHRPHPLSSKLKPTKDDDRMRHDYRVRAVRYESSAPRDKIIRLSSRFSEHFHIPNLRPLKTA